MRKIFYFLSLSLLLISCENVVDPSSVIQGEVNETLFRSNAEAAFNNEGELIIQGSNVDILTLKTNGNAVGIYEITPNSGNAASFVRDGSSFITSGPDTGGMIEIEEITNAYVTGNFFFEARRNGVGERLNFSKGEFWRIPFSDADSPEDEDEIDEDDLFEARVNGNNLDFFTITVMPEGNSIVINGTTTSQNSVAISIPNPSEVGEYTIGVDEGFEGSYLSPDGIEFATEGTVNITAFNEDQNIAAGTFSFTTDEGTNVTNGEFIANF